MLREHMKSFAYWFFDRATGTYLSLTILIVIVGSVSAASFEVYNIPQMTLKSRISATQTTEIEINAPTKNSVKITYPAGSGGVVEITQGTRSEHIYYERALVNSTTKVITLTGSVIRDLCYTATRTYTTCSNGQIFTPGAAVRFVVDMRTVNLKVNMDRPNSLTASGALSFSGSGSLGIPHFATYTELLRQLGSTPPEPRMGCAEDTGVCYRYFAGSWGEIATASGSFVNATESAAGKVQLASTGAMMTYAVSDNGPLVLQSKNLTMTGGILRNGSGIIIHDNSFKVPLLGSGGTLSGSLLGTGSLTSSTFLAGDGLWKGTYPLTVSKTTSYTAGNNELVVVNNSGGTITVTLPASPATDSRIGVVADVMTGSGTITINGNGKYIVGNSGSLFLRGDMRVMQYNGTEWNVISERITPHKIRLTRANAQTMPSGSDGWVQFDTVSYDVGFLRQTDRHVGSGAVIRRAGYYDIRATEALSNLDASETNTISIFKNGSRVLARVFTSMVTDSQVRADIFTTMYLAAGDKIDIVVTHNEGAGQAILVSSTDVPDLIITEIRP